MNTITIAPGHWLREDAAASYVRLRAAGMPAGVTDAGRTRAEQTAIYNRWRAELHLPVSQRKYKASAARPGTSRHETGVALDLPRAAATWLDSAEGRSHGWRRTIAAEWWHFEFFPELDQHRTTRPKRKAPAMVIIQNGSRYRVISGDRLVGVGSEDVPRFVAAGVPLVQVTDETWENFRAGFTPEG